MRSVTLALSFSLVTSFTLAQHVKRTNAEDDGFLGSVRSVRTTVSQFGVQFIQPGGPSLVLPVFCHDCDYDPDGTRTRSAQTVDGRVLGNSVNVERDPQGRVVKRETADLSGLVTQQEILGPFGVIERTGNGDGKNVYRTSMTYDESGNLSDITSSLNGVETDHTHQVSAKDGTLLRESTTGPDGLHYEETFDPETRKETFTRFDSSGAIIIKWTYANGSYTFWESPENQPLFNKFGEGYYEKISDTEIKNFQCHPDSRCDVSGIQYKFQGPGRHNPTSAEWRDDAGILLYAGYCDYTLDDTGNWTHRKIWVLSPEVPERTLYEEDTRTLTYWSR